MEGASSGISRGLVGVREGQECSPRGLAGCVCELEQIVCGADETPFIGDLLDSAQQDLSESSRRL